MKHFTEAATFRFSPDDVPPGGSTAPSQLVVG